MDPQEAKKQIEELHALRSATRAWRTGSVVAILVIVVVCVTTIITRVRDLAQEGPKQQQFMAELTSGMKKQVVPNFERIAKQTVNEMKPLVEKELQGLNQRAPELADAFQKELETLTQNVTDKGEKILNDTFGKALDKREEKIRQMFPEATPEKIHAALTSVVEEGHKQIDHISDTLFSGHVKAVGSISANLDAIRRSEKVNPADEVPTWEMAVLVLDLLREELKDFEPAKEPAAKPAPKPTVTKQ